MVFTSSINLIVPQINPGTRFLLLELGCRFFADYLNGDVFFKIVSNALLSSLIFKILKGK